MLFILIHQINVILDISYNMSAQTLEPIPFVIKCKYCIKKKKIKKTAHHKYDYAVTSVVYLFKQYYHRHCCLQYKQHPKKWHLGSQKMGGNWLLLYANAPNAK